MGNSLVIFYLKPGMHSCYAFYPSHVMLFTHTPTELVTFEADLGQM